MHSAMKYLASTIVLVALLLTTSRAVGTKRSIGYASTQTQNYCRARWCSGSLLKLPFTQFRTLLLISSLRLLLGLCSFDGPRSIVVRLL